MKRIQHTPCNFLFKILELFQGGNTKTQFMHINIPTLSVTHKHVIKL